MDEKKSLLMLAANACSPVINISKDDFVNLDNFLIEIKTLNENIFHLIEEGIKGDTINDHLIIEQIEKLKKEMLEYVENYVSASLSSCKKLFSLFSEDQICRFFNEKLILLFEYLYRVEKGYTDPVVYTRAVVASFKSVDLKADELGIRSDWNIQIYLKESEDFIKLAKEFDEKRNNK